MALAPICQPVIGRDFGKNLSRNRPGVAHFALVCGTNVPVLLSAGGFGIGSICAFAHGRCHGRGVLVQSLCGAATPGPNRHICPRFGGKRRRGAAQ